MWWNGSGGWGEYSMCNNIGWRSAVTVDDYVEDGKKREKR